MTSTRTYSIVIALCISAWVLMHLPGILHGTRAIPLHGSYVGDEQVSVNSALRMLNEKSILAFRNRPMQYYGPFLVLVDTPGVVLDAAIKFATGQVHSAEEYKNYIVWDWGGIIRNIRVTAMLSMLLGLVAVYKLARTATMNRYRVWYLPYLATTLVGLNYYYFEFSNFSLHWAYVIPLLLWQYYTYVRIIETEGRDRSYWVYHGLAVAGSFGVSYFSILFSSMWVPTLWRIVRERDGAFARRFGVWCAGTGVAFALIIWWHPLAFFRLLSFMGVGDPMTQMGTGQNPFVVSLASLTYYAREVVLNHLALVAAAILMLGALARTRRVSGPVLAALLLPGIMNVLLFGPAEHYEGRYMLPTIVSLLLAAVYLVAVYAGAGEHRRRLLDVALVTLVIWQVGFHAVHIGVWMNVFGAGPEGEQAVATALAMQQRAGPILIVNSYLMNYPHTEAAYRAFQQKRRYTDSALYDAMFAHPPAAGVPLLNARYVYLDDVRRNPDILRAYPYSMWLYKPRETDWIQFTYFDEDIVRNWFHADLSPRYFVVTNPSYATSTSWSTDRSAGVSPFSGTSGTSTLYALATSRRSAHCTFALEIGATRHVGSIEVGSSSMRAELLSKVALGTTLPSYLVATSGSLYFWGHRPEGNDQGTSITVRDLIAHEGGPSAPTLPVGFLQPINLQCGAPTVTPATFSVPNDVTFFAFDPALDG